MPHIVNQITRPALRKKNKLHVIGVISNPQRYHSRYRLFRKWQAEMLATPNVELYIVELAFGDRGHEVTDHRNPRHLQLTTKHELWHKENMINLGARYLLPRDWKYMAWVDTDIHFRDKNWAQKALHELQHHDVIQPWSQAADLGPHGNIMQLSHSFGYIHQLGIPIHRRKRKTPPQPNYHYAHSGYAWCCTRRFWENLPGKGLIDFAVLGSGDHHMAWAMIGEYEQSLPNRITDGYKNLVREWQECAIHITNQEIGYIKGRIEHHFHGPKAKRKYWDRWEILIRNKFDPNLDLAYDHEGLAYILGKPKLKHAIHKYFRSRCEDSVDED